jgi:transcriptional regulator with XRE-family HTH domain
MAGSIKIDELGELVRQKRLRENLTLRVAASQCGVSAATLSRLENRSVQGLPDAGTLASVARWLGVSVDSFLSKGSEVESGDTVEEVHAHLRADRNLSKEAADALAELVRVVYKQFTQGKDK